jgi:S1-C subfamily serine protease
MSPRRLAVLLGAAVFVFGVAGAPMSPAFAGKKDRKHRRVHEIKIRSGAFLGVKMQELTDEVRDGLGIKAKSGVLINDVIKDSPAEKAGIEDGDVVVKFGRKKVTSPEQLSELVADAEAGDEVKVELHRDSKSMTVEVTLGDWSDQPTVSFVTPGDFEFDFRDARSFVSSFRPFRLGVQVSSLNEDLAPYFGVKEGEGILVLEVHDESTAKEAGVKAGDVIVGIADKDIKSISDIHEAMSEMDTGDDFEMTVVRKKKKVTLKGEVSEHSRAFFGDGAFSRVGRAPHIEIMRGDDLKKEVEQLRKELEEIKKELKKSKSS